MNREAIIALLTDSERAALDRLHRWQKQEESPVDIFKIPKDHRWLMEGNLNRHIESDMEDVADALIRITKEPTNE